MLHRATRTAWDWCEPSPPRRNPKECGLVRSGRRGSQPFPLKYYHNRHSLKAIPADKPTSEWKLRYLNIARSMGAQLHWRQISSNVVLQADPKWSQSLTPDIVHVGAVKRYWADEVWKVLTYTPWENSAKASNDKLSFAKPLVSGEMRSISSTRFKRLPIPRMPGKSIKLTPHQVIMQLKVILLWEPHTNRDMRGWSKKKKKKMFGPVDIHLLGGTSDTERYLAILSRYSLVGRGPLRPSVQFFTLKGTVPSK